MLGSSRETPYRRSLFNTTSGSLKKGPYGEGVYPPNPISYRSILVLLRCFTRHRFELSLFGDIPSAQFQDPAAVVGFGPQRVYGDRVSV